MVTGGDNGNATTGLATSLYHHQEIYDAVLLTQFLFYFVPTSTQNYLHFVTVVTATGDSKMVK